jgi:hypothetical protein
VVLGGWRGWQDCGGDAWARLDRCNFGEHGWKRGWSGLVCGVLDGRYFDDESGQDFET